MCRTRRKRIGRTLEFGRSRLTQLKAFEVFESDVRSPVWQSARMPAAQHHTMFMPPTVPDQCLGFGDLMNPVGTCLDALHNVVGSPQYQLYQFDLKQ